MGQNQLGFFDAELERKFIFRVLFDHDHRITFVFGFRNFRHGLCFLSSRVEQRSDYSYYNSHMERRILTQGQEITFSVKRSRRRRTVALQIGASGTVTVYAPQYAWNFFVDRFVMKHAGWVLKKLNALKENLTKYPPRAQIPEAFREDYRQKTQDRLPAVVSHYAQALGVRPRSIKVANQRSRWGSCTARGDVRFSWRLGGLPDSIFNYIVVHELAHLKEMNHGPRFWALVRSQIPNHKEYRKWLRLEAPL